MRAALPNRSRTSSMAASRPSSRPLNGSASCSGRSSSRLADGEADQREALLGDLGMHAGEQASGPRRGRRRCRPSARGSVCERVARVKSSNRIRSTTVRPTRSAARMPAGDPVDDGRPAWRRARPWSRADRPSARCEPIERRRRADAAPAGGRGCGRARAGGGPTPARASRPARPRRAAATSPTVPDAAVRAASPAVIGPDAPQPLDRQRVEEVELAIGRHDQQAVGLAHAARHLGEELGAGHADGDRPARPGRGPRARSCAAISTGVPDDPPQAAHVQERLVDRDALDQRRGVARTPRTPRGWPRRRPTSGAGRRSASGHSRRASRAAHRACGRRTPWPRSWRRARPRRRRPPACRAAPGRRAARPTRRTRRGRRAGSWQLGGRCVHHRTHVRTTGRGRARAGGCVSGCA